MYPLRIGTKKGTLTVRRVRGKMKKKLRISIWDFPHATGTKIEHAYSYTASSVVQICLSFTRFTN